jgi:hypothetical protein
MDNRSLIDLWLDLAYWIAGNDEFWAGFVAALVLLGSMQVAVWTVQALYFFWLKVRQFFEPTKKPGTLPTTPGPSPFTGLLTCAGALIALVLLVVGIVALVLAAR